MTTAGVLFTDEALLYPQELFSLERFRGESPAEAKPVDVGRAAHERQSRGEEHSVYGLQAAYERQTACSHSNG